MIGQAKVGEIGRGQVEEYVEEISGWGLFGGVGAVLAEGFVLAVGAFGFETALLRTVGGTGGFAAFGAVQGGDEKLAEFIEAFLAVGVLASALVAGDLDMVRGEVMAGDEVEAGHGVRGKVGG